MLHYEFKILLLPLQVSIVIVSTMEDVKMELLLVDVKLEPCDDNDVRFTPIGTDDSKDEFYIRPLAPLVQEPSFNKLIRGTGRGKRGRPVCGKN